MPHCIIEYSKEIENSLSPARLLKATQQDAFNSGLFQEQDIKTRTLSFAHYQEGNTELDLSMSQPELYLGAQQSNAQICQILF